MPSALAASHRPDSEAISVFIVRQSAPRVWDVSAPDHSVGGMFCSREEACRYARGEARTRDHAEIVVLGGGVVDLQTFDDHRPVGRATYALSAQSALS